MMRPLRFGVSGIAIIVLCASATGDSYGVSIPKVCRTVGVTTAVGIETFGAGAKASDGFNIWGWCQITYGPGSGQKVLITIEPKRLLPNLEAGEGVRFHPTLALKGLGSGAVAVMGGHTVLAVAFAAGAYAVAIRNEGDGKAPFPTAAEYEALANVVRAHLIRAPANLCVESGMCVPA